LLSTSSESEHVPQSKLDHSVAVAAKNLAGVGIREAAIARVRYAHSGRRGCAQIEMIEGVEEIAAKLHTVRLTDSKRFLQPDVPVPVTGAVNHIPLRVAP